MPMEATPHTNLSRRERQIMDVVYRHGEVTVTEVLEELPAAPTYSAVRAMLRKLEEKGHLHHDAQGSKYVYRPVVPRDAVRETALQRLIRTFFDGSASKTMAAILDVNASDLTETELAEMAALIEHARRREEC